MAEMVLFHGWTVLNQILGEFMYKKFFLTTLATVISSGSLFAASDTVTGVVNFSSCIADSKHGKKEQENLESLRKQMTTLIENTDKELKDIAAKFENSEYLDSLSPKAEEELRGRYQALQEDMQRYQGQFYQVLQHANYQMVQKISSNIAKAAEEVAKKNKLDYVINKEACFYVRSDLDVTPQVISTMDRNFEVESKNKKLSDNNETENLLEEITNPRAG